MEATDTFLNILFESWGAFETVSERQRYTKERDAAFDRWGLAKFMSIDEVQPPASADSSFLSWFSVGGSVCF